MIGKFKSLAILASVALLSTFVNAQQCGSQNPNGECSNSCCSQYGYCGTTSDYCGTGCQSSYGQCDSPSGGGSSLPVSSNGQCGSAQGTQCPSGQCCSQYNYCGTTSDYCGTGCQSGFGTCTSGGNIPGNPGNPVTATVYNKCTASNSFSLTFDDGPVSITNDLLDTLANKNQKATFFVNGNSNGCIYDHADVIQRIVNEGHQLAHHTWSHPSLPELSDDVIISQITLLETALRKIVGRVPKYFRPPYGAYDDRVLGILGNLGYQYIITWDIDSGDTGGLSADQSEQVYRDAIANSPSPNPHTALNHDTKPDTVYTVAPFAIDYVTQSGYSLQTVGECLGNGNDWYKETVSPSARDSTWTCT
ncbi:1732_t:CDS:2 [Ambispora gerdemannii]|uniref:1732_t:CDS:1 n=1 Tax=Ambispora gerdemannii TaxID=144530 RepID=A0A9N9FEE2_9GLOM|nr:1732_t:CDS:2 [Ambispora gerdemannii]